MTPRTGCLPTGEKSQGGRPVSVLAHGANPVKHNLVFIMTVASEFQWKNTAKVPVRLNFANKASILCLKTKINLEGFFGSVKDLQGLSFQSK